METVKSADVARLIQTSNVQLGDAVCRSFSFCLCLDVLDLDVGCMCIYWRDIKSTTGGTRM